MAGRISGRSTEEQYFLVKNVEISGVNGRSKIPWGNNDFSLEILNAQKFFPVISCADFTIFR